MSGEENDKKVRNSEIPTFDTIFPWSKKNGKMTDLGRGIAYGMHLCGVPTSQVAKALGLSSFGMRKSLFRGRRNGTPRRSWCGA
jgi:hypothetical protein